MKKNTRKGFTITELVIVIAVIAILAAVLIPTFSGIIGKANDSSVLQGARARYTTYTAEWDYTTGSPAQNLIIEKDEKWVVVKGAQMQDDVYDTLAEAEAKANAGSVILCEDHNWTDGACVDCEEECEHDYAADAAVGTACGICGKAKA